MTMQLEEGETVVLNEGKLGWRKTLALTNRRLLFLHKDQIEGEIRLADIAEVYPHTKLFTNLTEMKIKLKTGNERTVLFKSGDTGLLLGGLEYADQNARSMADRYINAIRKAVDSLPRVT